MNRRNEVMVGLVIVAGVLVTVLGTLWLQGRSWGEVTRVEVIVQEAGQLLAGNPVKVRGVAIGRVEEVRVDEAGDAVRIVMELRGDLRLPADPAVILAPESLFGDWQAEIVSRSSYPRYRFSEVREPSTQGMLVLPGYALPDFGRLTAAADEIASNITTLTDRVELAFTDETADNIREAIDNVQRISERLASLVEQQGTAVQSVTDEVGKAAAEIGSAAVAARATFEHTARMLEGGVVDSILESTRRVTADLQGVTAELGETSRATRDAMFRADTALAGLARIVTRIDSGEGSLGRLLADDGVAVRTETALDELSLLLQDVRENPRRYVRLSIF